MHTLEMIMVAAASFMFAHKRLRVDLASTPKRSLVELLLLSAVGARSIMSLTRLGLRLHVHLCWVRLSYYRF